MRVRSVAAASPDMLLWPRGVAALGGSWYYLIAGVALVVSGVLIVLRDVRGVSLTRFTSVDVVRHPLVARIVEAYDEYHAQHKDA